MEPNRRSKTGKMAMLLRYLLKKLSPPLEVKVSEVTSTPSITLLLSFLSAIVVFVMTSHPFGFNEQSY
jgi:phosphomannomutase